VVNNMLRRLVPSVPVLARTPVAGMLDVADYFVKRRHSEWAKLPPASLRMRIGVGNTILNNHAAFIRHADDFVAELSERGYLTPRSQVLELGCGCGRNARAFKEFLGPEGRYTGQDVDAEMIAWCNTHLGDARARFEHADLLSLVYNPTGKSTSDYRFPAADGSISLIVAVSVFSHLLYDDANHYIRESSRVLMPGGRLHMTHFIMDYIRPYLGQRWTFAHKQDRCYVENARYPEAAVAFDLAVIKDMLEEHGLAFETIYNEKSHQQTVIARKL